MREKQKWPNDSDVGIRTLTQIDNLPVKELTDEEVCKLFFKRFGAKALVMLYIDSDGKSWAFGRIKRGLAIFNHYRRLSYWMSRVIDFHNWRQIDATE